MSSYRFDVHSLAIILPFTILVTLGLTFSAFSLTYGSYFEIQKDFEVRAWWDGDHADVTVRALSTASHEASVTILIPLQLGEEVVYTPSFHQLTKNIIGTPGELRLFTSVAVSKNFIVIIETAEEKLTFKVNLR